MNSAVTSPCTSQVDYSGLKLAIVGATGAVGLEMMEELTASSLFVGLAPAQLPQVRLFASARSQGQRFTVLHQDCAVHTFAVDDEYWRHCDIALVSAGGDFSRQYLPQLVAAGVIIIDNSSAWRLDADVALVVPEVNAHLLAGVQLAKDGEGERCRAGMIIANPNCSTIQLMVAVAPLEQAFGLKTLVATTYQSVSGAGQAGIQALKQGLGELDLDAQAEYRYGIGAEPVVSGVFGAPIAANVIPVIGEVAADGYSTEERKMIFESRKILQRQDLHMMATAVRVPVFVGHSIAVSLELARSVELAEVQAVLAAAPGLRLAAGPLLTPRGVAAMAGSHVARLRLATAQAETLPASRFSSSWLELWNVADNLKKGAASNAVQILEEIVQRSSSLGQ